jgi:hypothetical protein
MSNPAPTPPVKRRRVHYFSGFDPRGAAHYHRLCREEASKPQPHGGALQVGAREKISPMVSRWRVAWSADASSARKVQTEHVFMGWDDLIRANWSRTPMALAREFVGTYVHIFRHIGAARVWRMYRPAFKAGALPLAVLLGPILVAALLGAAVGIWGWVIGLMAAMLIGGLALRGGLLWLLRIYTFFTRMGRGPIDGHGARTAAWVEQIVAQQQADPVDEVLLVGHSVGTLIMVDTVDSLLRDARWQALQGARPTAVLTLGQSFPMVALAPAAHGFRDALQRLSQHASLCWWDVTARIDPLCFYNLHPLADAGVPKAGARWPVLHAARFMHMYEPARWARIRANKLQAHFLYLMTSDKPGNFSLMDVLYGPRSLSQQIAAKGSGPHG